MLQQPVDILTRTTCYLLSFISDSYFGRGQSFHATGGRGSKKAQLRHCIRVLRSVTSVGDETINQDLCDQGAIGQLLGDCAGHADTAQSAGAHEFSEVKAVVFSQES